MNQTDIINKTWDYIIEGTGMGGGTLGLKLAQAGFSVLFIEKGRNPSEPMALTGKFAELLFNSNKPDNKVLEKAGRSTDEIIDCTAGRSKSLSPFMGSLLEDRPQKK
jgi:choline dehydrogenase-like flavoprotein